MIWFTRGEEILRSTNHGLTYLDLGRVRGLPPEEGAGGAAHFPDTAPGLPETVLTILSPFIALALLLLIMVMVLGRGLGPEEEKL